MFALRKTLKPPPPSSFFTFFTTATTVKPPEPATSAAYDELTYTAGLDHDFTTVHHLLNQRFTKGYFTTVNTFNFISSDNISIVLEDVLKTIASLNGNSIKKSYESLISRLCRLQNVDEALRVAEAAACGGNAYLFHSILSVLTRKKDFEYAWRVVEVMKDKNIKRDVTCYNFFLTSYAVVGDLRASVEVLKKMGEDGLKADARTYDALVLGACKMGKMDGAMAILRRMVDDGVEGIHATYAHVIVYLVKLDYCAQAVKFVMSYGGNDRKLDLHNFGLLATRLISAKKFDEAKFVLEEMVKRELDMSENLKAYYDKNVKCCI